MLHVYAVLNPLYHTRVSQHTYKDIVEWYSDLAKQNPNLVKFVESIGNSMEGRNQPAVHITAAGTSQYRVFLQCLIHACELLHQVL